MVAPLIIAGARVAVGRVAQQGASVAARKSVSSQFMSRKSVPARVGLKQHVKSKTKISTGGTFKNAVKGNVRERVVRHYNKNSDGGKDDAAKMLVKKVATRFFITTVLPWLAAAFAFFLSVGIIFTAVYAHGGKLAEWLLPTGTDVLFYAIAAIIALFTYVTYKFIRNI